MSKADATLTVERLRREDTDFITVDSLRGYGHTEDEARWAIRHWRAQEVLKEHDANSWGGSSDLNELAGSKYAVVWKRDDDSWVLRAADVQDIAGHYLDAAHGPDTPDYEWVEAVIDLDTGEPVATQNTITVRVTLPDGSTATRS